MRTLILFPVVRPCAVAVIVTVCTANAGYRPHSPEGEKDRLDWLLAHDKRRWANAKKVFDQTADRLA